MCSCCCYKQLWRSICLSDVNGTVSLKYYSNRLIDGLINRLIDGLINGLIDGLINGLIDG